MPLTTAKNEQELDPQGNYSEIPDRPNRGCPTGEPDGPVRKGDVADLSFRTTQHRNVSQNWQNSDMFP